MTDLKKLLDDLHTGLAQELLSRINSGEATASDLNVVRQFLKDNGIDSVPKGNNPLQRLTAALPFSGADEDDAEATPLPN
ncbi:MAG: hypothetical protein J0I48_15085 [Devosia sp.]|uniref:hypothetical protein n=1 Tax=Devosia sp. 66-22 TaxID=1895753 RepID=UPI00092C9DD1|nr:hypothetical protein [Devosia sp. 66-22]MBN9347496.1 hypothetical protein [Devosia sp.]OJX53641.1 MAG: hypothetical protein BGO81_13825 [Devosia sp. 66-22]